MKPIIKVKFTSFWPQFKERDNIFYNLLSKHYQVEISDNPDFVFYSSFGLEFKNYDCIRIFYTGENRRTNFNECDYAFTFDFIDNPRHYRLPLYFIHSQVDVAEITKPKPDLDELLASKTKFCNLVVSNGAARKRIQFYDKLCKYKQVDSGGGYMNNVGGPVGDKFEFMRPYKFTISFENSSYPGYTTEKIFEPMLVNSIPIYWGNPLVERDFNPKSFINVHDYKNEEEAIEQIIKIDQDDELFKQYLSEPYFHNNEVNEFVKEENIVKQLKTIIESKGKIEPVAQQTNTLYKRVLRKAKSKLGRIIRE